MLFRDAYAMENLLKYRVKTETVPLYKEGISALQALGFEVAGIVCDGKRGLFTAFGDIPVQMCQFHQQKIVTTYLTKHPKSQAGRELRSLSLSLTETDRKTFERRLWIWGLRWSGYLNFRSKNEKTGKSWYMHKELRSAYNSLLRNLPYLFTYESHPQLGMPNTTNAIDGHFSELKRKMRDHNGMSKGLRDKFIDEFLGV